MSRGVNKVILIGRLGKNPDIRVLPNSGEQVANFSLATSEVWNDRQTGERRERTEWHRVVFFGKQADLIRMYVKKGSQLYVEGRLQTRKWTNNQGIDQYTTEIIGTNMAFLDSKDSGEPYAAPAADYLSESAASERPQTIAPKIPAQSDTNIDSGFGDADIPF